MSLPEYTVTGFKFKGPPNLKHLAPAEIDSHWRGLAFPAEPSQRRVALAASPAHTYNPGFPIQRRPSGYPAALGKGRQQ